MRNLKLDHGLTNDLVEVVLKCQKRPKIEAKEISQDKQKRPQRPERLEQTTLEKGDASYPQTTKGFSGSSDVL
jgi:hypothetical protein